MSAFEDDPFSIVGRNKGPHVSNTRKFINIIACLLALPICWIATVYSRYPVTLDLFITIALAELNRFFNEGRRIRFYDGAYSSLLQNKDVQEKEQEKSDPEMQTLEPQVDCMAAVVGWREDPGLFTRALQSYKVAESCAFLLVGIDGDEEPDQDMVDVFNKVFPQQAMTISIPDPLGDVAEHVMDKLRAANAGNELKMDESEYHQMAMQRCIHLARAALEQEGFNATNIRRLCIRQRHMHKKGIMFTTYIFALVIADMLGVEFLWSSDSDTLVFPDSLRRTVDSIAADPNIGGASSGLLVHNESDSAITSLASTVYWGELYLTRSTPAATATSDCQSGPSTLFRLSALPEILVPWYLQTMFGKRMIINEDRHLTTNLLTRGWGVVFASDVLAATDTPTTLARWVMQQVRWGRATHLESLLQPKVYLMSHPLLFYTMCKREFGPAIAAVAVVYYFVTSTQFLDISVMDLFVRVLISFCYNIIRNPHRPSRQMLPWVIPGIFFYYIPLPAVHVWSMMTLTADGWGTSMRASGERAKKNSLSKAWWETGFFIIWMGIVAGTAAKYFTILYGLGEMQVLFATVICTLGAAAWAWKATIGNLVPS